MYTVLLDYLKLKSNISETDFHRFRDQFKLKTLKRKQHLLRQGTTCTNLYFVNQGCLRFYHLNEEGKELTRYFAFEGKFGTDLSSFISDRPSRENIQAVEDSELLVIEKGSFKHLVQTEPSINAIYVDMLEMAYVTSVQRIYNFQGEETLERLKWLMRYQPKVLSRLPSKVVASYLGITPYTLSRLKTKL